MRHVFEKRVLMVTGKGGVGKTTITAALARLAAQEGKRVLAVDVDKNETAPSTLLELLSGKTHFAGDEPVEITPKLHCARLSPRIGQHDFLRDHLPMKLLANAAARSKHLERFLMAAPGFQEMGIIYRLLVFLRRQTSRGEPLYDFVLVDLPATGHALALTSLPKPLLRVFSGGPVERTIRDSQEVFNNSETTGCLVVTLPEPLPVSETFELVKGLRRDSMEVSGIWVNRWLENPLEEDEESVLADWFDAHAHEYMGEWSFRRILRARDAFLFLKDGMTKRGFSIPVVRSIEQQNERASDCLEAIVQEMTVGAFAQESLG